MADRKKSSKAQPNKPTEKADKAVSVTDSLGKLGFECQNKLQEIASSYAQVTNLESTNLNRALAEQQFAAQIASQEFWHNLSSAALRVNTSESVPQDLEKLNLEYAEQLEAIGTESNKSLENAHQQVSQSLADGTETANQQWDAACAEFVKSVQEVVAQLDPSDVNSQDLFSLGQSLFWISKHYRTNKNPD